MASLFDSPEFNERLFFPRPDRSRTPDGAIDLDVPGDETLHVRWHRGPAGAPTLLLFHGNGEIVSDYDRSAREFAAAGVGLAVMDFRGYGRSTGTPTLRSALSDASNVLEVVRARVATPPIVIGPSLGSPFARGPSVRWGCGEQSDRHNRGRLPRFTPREGFHRSRGADPPARATTSCAARQRRPRDVRSDGKARARNEAAARPPRRRGRAHRSGRGHACTRSLRLRGQAARTRAWPRAQRHLGVTALLGRDRGVRGAGGCVKDNGPNKKAARASLRALREPYGACIRRSGRRRRRVTTRSTSAPNRAGPRGSVVVLQQPGSSAPLATQ